MPKLITHPDNLELIKRFCKEDKLGLLDPAPFGLEIVTDKHLEVQRWTGRYVLPDGRAVPKEEVAVPDGRFFEWGNSDLEIKLLLEWGLIKKEMEPLFYMMEDWSWRHSIEMPMIMEPKYFVTNRTF